MRIIAFIICVVIAFAASAVEIKKWVDENGMTHYGDRPPEDVVSTDVIVKSKPVSLEEKSADNTEYSAVEQLRRLEAEKAEIAAEKKKNEPKPSEKQANI